MSMSVTHRSERAQDTVAVVPATTPQLVEKFIEFSYELYADDPHWIPELRRDAYRRVSPKHNPFLAHADIALFLAVDGGRTVGRIAAIEDRAHNEYHHERLAWFGFFEARDGGVAAALLAAVEHWGAARGCTAVRGPANPSLNESAGLLVQGFDDDPYLLMPYNPPAYAEFIEGAGYVKAKDLLGWDLDLTQPLGARIEKLAERVRRRNNIVVRRVDMKQFDRDLALMQSIYRSAWEDNWGFVPPTDAEMRQLATDLKPVIDPDLVLFAEMDGKAISTVVVLPDVNQVLKRMHGRLLPFGLWHFLNRKKIINRCRLVLLGVVAEYRNVGLYPLMISEIHRRGVANGYIRGELSWTLEDNHSVNAGIEASGGRRYKLFRLYEKPIG
jgi:GNAT superfamily N-acetyltransferase